MFVDTNKTIDIVDDENAPEHKQNVIRIRERLSVGEKARVSDQYLQVTFGADNKPVGQASVGKLGFALLQHYIVSWSGPKFAGVKCTPEMVGLLDDDEPLVRKVAQRVGELWRAAQNTDPKESDGASEIGAPSLTDGSATDQ